MPRVHRDFLSQIELLSNVRDYALRRTTPVEIREAYNKAVTAVVGVRDIHIRIVSRYITMPSRSPPASYIMRKEAVNLATAPTKDPKIGRDREPEREQLQGTGGTDLIPFLKRTRDETRETFLRLDN